MLIKKIVHFILLATIFILPAFALIVVDSYFFPFITGKAFFFRILVEIAFASWIILAFIDPKYRPKITPLSIGVTIFAVVALIADFLGVNPLRSIWSNFERMEGWITIVHLWALFIVFSNTFGFGEEGKRIWQRWINAELFIAFIVSIYAIVQLAGGAEIHQGSRVDASLGNAAYMAVYMLFNVGLAAYMSVIVRMKKIIVNSFLKWMYPVLSILFGFILFETATRGTILGLFGGLMLALAIYSIFGKDESKKSRLISGGIIFAIILVGIVFWMNKDASFIQKNEALRRMASISWSDTSNQARQYIWPMAIKGTLERPIFGWGQENFNYIFNTNYNPKMWSQEQWFDRAHNVFLDWFVAGGFVGFIAYLALYILFLLAIWKSNLSIAEKSIFTGLIAGYAVHNVFVFDNLASYILFFSVLGFANSLHEGKPIKWFGTNPLRADAVEYIVLPILVIVLALSLYFLNVRIIMANTRLITALSGCAGGTMPNPALFQKALSIDSYTANQEIREQLLTCAGNVINAQQLPGTVKQNFFQLAVSEIEKQKISTPKDARIYVLGGTFMNSIGQLDLARPLLEKAVELSPKKQSAILLLAINYINSGKKDEALIMLKNAYESANNNLNVKNAYVIALVLTGKEADARKLSGEDQSIFDSQQMAQVYISMKQYSKAIPIYLNLVKSNPDDVNIRAELARVQYADGQVYNAISTMRSISKDRPELKDQVEAAIKEIQK